MRTTKIRVKGAVQGVGYRPFVSKYATEYGLKGWVKNIGAAVDILVTGEESKIKDFIQVIKNEHPAGAFILDVQITDETSSELFDSFNIYESSDLDLTSELAVFLPDIGICDKCLNEMLDKNDRRFHYPLISCANCGPRISILDKIPYDRDTTRMLDFKMCPKCHKEYLSGRRHHAQTISCHDCGPQMILRLSDKDIHGSDAIETAISILSNGGIIGLKGIAGFQFICKPEKEPTIRLRKLKGREEKPFAVMFKDIDSIKEYCEVLTLEENLLKSYSRPIVLLNKIKDFPYEVCKESRYIGAFLPSAGIHYMLLERLGPLIVTSANVSDETMVIRNEDYFRKFLPYTDGVLYHDRDINMALDDSVMYVIKDKDNNETSHFIRRARGFVPLPIILNKELGNKNVLALGSDLKNTFSFAKKDRIISSQYIGDLQDKASFDNLNAVKERFSDIFKFEEQKIICDAHPLYYSSKLAKDIACSKDIEVDTVYHHHAHILSVMAEHSLTSAIGVSFDGTGYGDDGRIWGSEFLYCNKKDFLRKGHLSYVKLSGGNIAPKKANLVRDSYFFADNKDCNINALQKSALINNINTYETSSMGRLFDAVASVLDICHENNYEGECATLVENAALSFEGGSYPEFTIEYETDSEGTYIWNQIKLFIDIHNAYTSNKYSVNAICYGFHMALSKMVLEMCRTIRNNTLEENVCLSGGCFCNRLLTKTCVNTLKEDEFNVFLNEKVPCNDGGISLGQAYYGLLD